MELIAPVPDHCLPFSIITVLRKLAHAINRVFLALKLKISIEKCDIFNIFAQNIDCGYALEHSNTYPQSMFWSKNNNQRTIGPENAHLKPDLGVLSHNEMTLTLNTHTTLLTS